MIVLDEGPTYRLVSQPEHARLAASIAAMFRGALLPAAPRRDDVLFAVREHDNGWEEVDERPGVDPRTHGPTDFLAAPGPLRRGIWQRGAERHAEARPYSALLITRHARRLHEAFRRAPDWQDLLGRLDALERELARATGAGAADVEADYGTLAVADLLSLAVCKAWRGPFGAGGSTGTVEGNALRLSPFPLGEPARFAIACRRIPAREYAGEAELARAIEAAPAESLEVALLPAGP